jgi:hypothetical protein
MVRWINVFDEYNNKTIHEIIEDADNISAKHKYEGDNLTKLIKSNLKKYVGHSVTSPGKKFRYVRMENRDVIIKACELTKDHVEIPLPSRIDVTVKDIGPIKSTMHAEDVRNLEFQRLYLSRPSIGRSSNAILVGVAIYEILNPVATTNPMYPEMEKTFEGLIGVGGGLLRFDYYFRYNDSQFLVEYDGELHNEKSCATD